MKRRTIILLSISIPVGVLLVIAIAVMYITGSFLPTYQYENGAVVVDGKPYSLYPLTDWQPEAERVKIGRLEGSPYAPNVPVMLYKYDGDYGYFVWAQPVVSSMNAVPWHRTDITLPKFSAEVIDTVELGFGSDMIRQEGAGYKNVKITDKASIALLAECLSESAMNRDNAMPFDQINSFRLYARSTKYPGMSYRLEAAVYGDRYYLVGRDGSMYEIPLDVLEQVSGLDLYSAAEYTAIDDTIRTLRKEKWRKAEGKDEYLFFDSRYYVIFEVTERKAVIKEKGEYKVNGEAVRMMPEGGSPYTFNIDAQNKRLTPSTGSAGWVYDESDVSVLTGKKSGGMDVFWAIENEASKYFETKYLH